MAEMKTLSIGGLVAALLFIIMLASFLSPVNTSVTAAAAAVNDTTQATLIGLIFTVFVIGGVYSVYRLMIGK